MADPKKTDRGDGGRLPEPDNPDRSFGGEWDEEAARLPGEPDLSTQRGRDLPDGGYEAPDPGEAARGYGG